MVLKTKRKATVSLLSCCLLTGCNGWVPFTPYGNMPTQERYELQAKLNANPALRRSVDYSYGTYELIGERGWTVRTQPPQGGRYRKDNSRPITIEQPKFDVPDF